MAATIMVEANLHTFGPATPEIASTSRRSLFHHLISLLFLIAVAGAVNVCLGKDYSWDLRNYHYYNAWAFLKHRLDVDVLPANIQGFLNPLIELPFYFLASKKVNDYFIAYAMAIPVAVSILVLWKICGVLTRRGNPPSPAYTLVLRVITVIAAVTGGAGWCQWGTTSGEWPVTCLALMALYFAVTPQPTAKHKWAVGPLLGLACGLKLTAIPFSAAIALTYLWIEVSTKTAGRRMRICVFFTAGCAAFLAAIAPWGIVLWDHFRNPFFPYFNGIFKSDIVQKSNWRDTRFLPLGLDEKLGVALDLALHREAKYGDSPVRDPRTLVAWLLIIGALIAAVVSPKYRERLRVIRVAAPVIVFVTSYVLWLHAFAIYRYAIGIEMGACLVMYTMLANRQGPQVDWRSWASFALFLPMLATSVDSLGRTRFNGGRYFQEHLPLIPPGSLVINYIATDPPLGYLSPLMGRHVTVIKPVSNLSRPGWHEWFQDRIRQTILAARGPIYVIQKPPMTQATRAHLDRLGLVASEKQCENIKGPTFVLEGYVCEFRKKND